MGSLLKCDIRKQQANQKVRIINNLNIKQFIGRDVIYKFIFMTTNKNE